MRDIKGYEGLYAATEDGRIFSYKSNKFLKLGKRKDDYLQVNLYKDGKQKKYLVHRLIASTYLDNPENLSQVNHKDEDKSNNSVQNLEYCDAKYNNSYGTRLEKIRKKILCVETNEVFESITEAAKAKNTNLGSISHCCKGQRNTAGSYHWKYYKEEKRN